MTGSALTQPIQLIERNRISTTEVADALGKRGVLSDVRPLNNDLHVVGPIKCVFAAHGSNYDVHEQITDVNEDCIVTIFTENCEGKAIIGDLIAKYLVLYKGVRAVVVDGLVRDAARLRRERYPVWSKGVTPLGCKNRQDTPFDPARRQELEEKFNSGGIAVCDDGGVVLIPSHEVNKSLVERLDQIELQEDIWSFCLSTLKWSTKEIVCDKRYLTDPHDLPKSFRERLTKLKRELDE